jgi:hypothetical protein
VRFLLENLGAPPMLCPGAVATLWAWCRTEVANRVVEILGRPECAIGPLLDPLRVAQAGGRRLIAGRPPHSAGAVRCDGRRIFRASVLATAMAAITSWVPIASQVGLTPSCSSQCGTGAAV